MIKILQLNIRSIRPNIEELKNYITKNSIDIVCLNETWLKKNEKVKKKVFIYYPFL